MRLFTTSSTPAGFTLTAPLSMPAQRRTGLRAHHATASASATSTVASAASANDSRYFSVAMDDKVRVLRRDVGDRARMVLSGRMADVCAALEHMSRAETVSLAG
ncbi:hypothetical protein [Comamonas terrigena]|uniref:hypothetical protein n=1 Tax=Comamonas terrigena TaxID=32013 RepID=UPI0024498C2B|nr:hypothetical protein [Comamonas terrigena]MDH1700184.1 hypothetical protein [Comamonas terrigena]